MNRLFCLLAVALMVVVVSGCSSTNRLRMPSKQGCGEGCRVLFAQGVFGSPRYYKGGDQTKMDHVIAGVMQSQLMAHMKTLELDEFYGAFADLRLAFEQQGIEVLPQRVIIDYDNLQTKSARNGSGKPTKDFSYYDREYNADLIVMVKVERAGVERAYFGFVPLGSPDAVFSFKVIVVDPSNNDVVSNFSYKAEVDIEGEWDSPPGYRELSEAFYAAQNRAKDKLIEVVKQAITTRAESSWLELLTKRVQVKL